jgi:hypothetical protein
MSKPVWRFIQSGQGEIGPIVRMLKAQTDDPLNDSYWSQNFLHFDHCTVVLIRL